jgi:hypothetical protein
MSGISTKGVKKNFISKELKPGNVVAKIVNLSIEESKTPKDPSNPEYKIWIELEGKPMGGDFVGFDKVFGDPSKGQYAGQFKKIQFSNWPLRDYTGVSKKDGKEFKITAAGQILDFLQKLLDLTGNGSWLEDNDGKFDTWPQLFAGVMRSKALKDVYFSWCLAATESVNAGGYPVYYMYLPERRDAAEPFALEGGLVTTFEPTIHIKKNANLTQASEALNNGEDEEEENDFSNAPEDDPFSTDGDDELFDMED